MSSTNKGISEFINSFHLIERQKGSLYAHICTFAYLPKEVTIESSNKVDLLSNSARHYLTRSLVTNEVFAFLCRST